MTETTNAAGAAQAEQTQVNNEQAAQTAEPRIIFQMTDEGDGVIFLVNGSGAELIRAFHMLFEKRPEIMMITKYAAKRATESGLGNMLEGLLNSLKENAEADSQLAESDHAEELTEVKTEAPVEAV